MSDETSGLERARDRRWLIGWILRLSGAAVFAGIGLGTIGALRKWGLELPPAKLVTLGIGSLVAGALLGGGKILMKASPRVGGGHGVEKRR